MDVYLVMYYHPEDSDFLGLTSTLEGGKKLVEDEARANGTPFKRAWRPSVTGEGEYRPTQSGVIYYVTREEVQAR